MSLITDLLGISAYARNKQLLGEYTREQHKLCMRTLKECNLPRVSLMKMMHDNQGYVLHEVPAELEYKHGAIVFQDSLQNSKVLGNTFNDTNTYCTILSNALGRKLSVVRSYNCANDTKGEMSLFFGMSISDLAANKKLTGLTFTL